MNRRSFLNSLSAAVAGCYLAAHVRLADVVHQASRLTHRMVMVNPAWRTAPYEEALILAPDVARPPWPTRFNDNREVIPPFIEVEVGA